MHYSQQKWTVQFRHTVPSVYKCHLLILFLATTTIANILVHHEHTKRERRME
jgi:hypothetical protein